MRRAAARGCQFAQKPAASLSIQVSQARCPFVHSSRLPGHSRSQRGCAFSCKKNQPIAQSGQDRDRQCHSTFAKTVGIQLHSHRSIRSGPKSLGSLLPELLAREGEHLWRLFPEHSKGDQSDISLLQPTIPAQNGFTT